MKKYLFIFLLVGVGFGQDILKMDGKELKGEFIRFNADKKTFTFKFEGRDKPSDLPLDENRLDYIMLKNGEWAYVSPNFVEEVRKIEMAKKCEGNKNIKVSIIPLKNDKWAITETLQKESFLKLGNHFSVYSVQNCSHGICYKINLLFFYY